MYIIEILGFIVLIVMILNQSSRISAIEEAMKSGSLVRKQDQAKQPFKATESVVDVTKQDVAETLISTQASSTASPKIAEESSGRVLGGIGIAAVIIGISFFLKYAFDNDWVGPAGRVMVGIIAGLVLLGVGQSLRKKYVSYSDFLMGGGLVVLYLSVFSANTFFHLISPITAGVFMFFVTALGFAISIANATQALAVVSALGGFLTPFLVASP